MPTATISEHKTNRLHTGLRTTFRASPDGAALRVDWIAWDSPFRGTDLRVGDDIVAVDDEAIVPLEDRAARSRWIGHEQESERWTSIGARDGHAIRLTLRRQRIPGEGFDTVHISGAVAAERTYTNADGRQLFGPDGPARLTRDGFSAAWASWYERRVYEWERQLDGGPWRRAGSSRAELASHLEAEPRVRYLSEHYPGRFATAVAHDWSAVRRLLEGRQYDVAPEEFAYRQEGERMEAAVKAASLAAWDAFQLSHAQDVIAAPGPIDLVKDEYARLAGKLLVLPPASPNGWIPDVSGALVSWYQNDGWVLTRLESPALTRMWLAQHRYRRHVSPALADVFSLVGRILPESRMVAPKDRRAVVGVEVEPLAALMGRGDEMMFVDLTTERDGVSEFAAESEVRVKPSPLPPDDAPPRRVLEALIAALYAGDEESWFRLFADWHFDEDDDRPFYYPYYPYPEGRRDGDWTLSRRVVLDQTFAIRIVWMSEPRVLDARGLPEMPVIERVEAELDHVGRFGDEYRSFASSDVHRYWRLERRDGGPWRITTHQGI